jgi:hypothetical protein
MDFFAINLSFANHGKKLKPREKTPGAQEQNRQARSVSPDANGNSAAKWQIRILKH